MALSQITLLDTFNTWLTRTNQLITGHNTYEADIPAAFGAANGAYGQANTARIHANTAFANANIAYTAVQASFAAANASFANGNTNFVTLQLAFDQANLASTDAINSAAIGVASFANGNTNFVTLQLAFDKANAAFANTSGATFNGTLKVSSSIDAAYINVTQTVSNTNTSVTRLATNSEFRTGTSRNLALGVADVWDAALETPLTDGSSIAMDMATGFNFNINLVSQTTRTLSTPSNMKPGQSGYIRIKQGGASAQTMVYGPGWNFASGSVPSLSAGFGNTDLLFYQALSSANVFASLIKDIRLNY